MNAASSERCAAGPRIACGELDTLVQPYWPVSPVSMIRSSNTTRQALRTYWVDSRREASPRMSLSPAVSAPMAIPSQGGVTWRET